MKSGAAQLQDEVHTIKLKTGQCHPTHVCFCLHADFNVLVLLIIVPLLCVDFV